MSNLVPESQSQHGDLAPGDEPDAGSVGKA